MSWQIGAILFGICAFEGVRRLDPGDLVLRCNMIGAWRVTSPVRLWRTWYLVSVLPPFFLTIVVRREGNAKLLPNDASRARDLVRSIDPILALRMLCALDFFVLIFGIPWGISRGGSAGLLGFLACALAISASIVLRSAAVRMDDGDSGWAAMRRSMSFLSPFASPFAAEATLSSLLQRRSGSAVISGLLGEKKFRALILPAAYDVESRRAGIAGSLLDDIALMLSPIERVKILHSAADGCAELERFCPRCAARYSVETTICADCESVSLRAAKVE